MDESISATPAYATFTKIDKHGTRERTVSDQLALSLMSYPLWNLVQLPEDGEWPEAPKKWQYEHKKWWQGRWEIYLIFLGAVIFYYLFRCYRSRQLEEAIKEHKREVENDDRRAKEKEE